jgi:microcystin-dependent protein
MDEMFISAISVFGFNFPPRNWATCNGQIIGIAQNTALFSLLGTTFGGNGTTNFALPNLQSRVPTGMGQGPGLQNYVLGQQGGEANHTLLLTEMAGHIHPLQISNVQGNINVPVVGNTIATVADINGDAGKLFNVSLPNISLAANTIGQTGGSQAHYNEQPYLGLNICICMAGIFPSRN